MKQARIFYLVGAILLFIGLFWLFLPHAYHEQITEEHETSHITHMIEGIIITLIATLILILADNNLEKYKNSKKSNKQIYIP